MFQQLDLKYFRKHVDRSFTFEQGVVAIRGANEDGKTTILEGIAYAWFGAEALRDTLAEVVTTGFKETQLKVKLDFQIDGVDFRITRSKAGAELRTSDRILATGQTETKKFVEGLIKASSKAAYNLMLASQQSIQGALADGEGNGAAIKLIEALADFELIDNIISLAQTKLSTGSTVSVDTRIAQLEQQVVLEVEDTTGPLEAAAHAQDVIVVEAVAARDKAYVAYRDIQPAAEAAQAEKTNCEKLIVEVSNAAYRLDTAKGALSQIVPVPGPTEAEISELRSQVADSQRLLRAAAALSALGRLVEPANEWQGSLIDLQNEHTTAAGYATLHGVTVGDCRVKIAQLMAQRITETACGLCGKDLSEVPEVVTKNAALNAQIEEQEAAKTVAQVALTEAMNLREAYAAIIRCHNERQRTYQQAADFITLDEGFVPARWTWTGPDTTQPVGNAANALAQAESAARKYQQDLGRRLQAERDVETLAAAYNAAKEASTVADETLAVHLHTLELAAAATHALAQADTVLRDAQEQAKSALGALRQAQAVYAERVRAREALVSQLEAARKELADTQFNNDLIKRLREIRPQIVDELWGVVSGSISHYFSKIRGVPSRVVRENSGFRVNGIGMKNLSGSTRDALGMAVRIALTKTFLPGTDFFMFDEPAAAADENREANMLGVIATAEFAQVLVVTHSDQINSFANQVITL